MRRSRKWSREQCGRRVAEGAGWGGEEVGGRGNSQQDRPYTRTLRNQNGAGPSIQYCTVHIVAGCVSFLLLKKETFFKSSRLVFTTSVLPVQQTRRKRLYSIYPSLRY